MNTPKQTRSLPLSPNKLMSADANGVAPQFLGAVIGLLAPTLIKAAAGAVEGAMS